MVISQLLDWEELTNIVAIEGGVQTLEATIVNTVLTNAAVSKELKTALERKAKTIKGGRG